MVLFALASDFRKKILPSPWVKGSVILFSLLFVLLVGLRTKNVGSDTGMYYFQFNYNITYESITEIVFYALMQGVKYFSNSFTIFLLLVAFLFHLFLRKGVVVLSEYYKTNALLMFLSIVSLFFIQNMSINIIRQGIAMSFLFYFLSLWVANKSTKKSLIYLVLAFLAHTTSIIPILMFLGVLYIGKRWSIYYFLVLYFVGIALSFFNVGVLNIAPFITDILGADSRRVTYLTNESDLYTVGFKPQFVAFNTVFLGFSYYLYKSKLLENQWRLKYELLLKYFIVASFLFFMAFQIPYSDRWGLFSWMVIPVLMAPLFSAVKNGIRSKTLVVLFFAFIYAFFEILKNTK